MQCAVFEPTLTSCGSNHQITTGGTTGGIICGVPLAMLFVVVVDISLSLCLSEMIINVVILYLPFFKHIKFDDA